MVHGMVHGMAYMMVYMMVHRMVHVMVYMERYYIVVELYLGQQLWPPWGATSAAG